MDEQKLTLGLALSGSGNRTTFYIGFLEVLKEAGVRVDYITAMSGGSLAAAAYACGALEKLKEITLKINKNNIKQFIGKSVGHGGLYSLDPAEEQLRNLTQGKNFEEVRPIMSFVGVDIESGNLVDMCMGDIAKAAIVSCTLPGIFEPVMWGNKILVDGGLLSQVPVSSLKKFQPDVTVGINMRGTKHIFTEGQINFRKTLNFFKKILFFDQIGELLNGVFSNEDDQQTHHAPNIFTVLGKSMDLAILANKAALKPKEKCDLLITPIIPKLNRTELSEEAMLYYYNLGRQNALNYLPKIKSLLKEKK